MGVYAGGTTEGKTWKRTARKGGNTLFYFILEQQEYSVFGDGEAEVDTSFTEACGDQAGEVSAIGLRLSRSRWIRGGLLTPTLR